ncbi:hypothetical protein [Trichoplusia ni ascovirus 6b]|nr:hypothetical protein [Trichoplusia ni ascovirus 6b]
MTTHDKFVIRTLMLVRNLHSIMLFVIILPYLICIKGDVISELGDITLCRSMGAGRHVALQCTIRQEDIICT